jgi:small-conductance mechanosensitive channel
MKAFFFSLAVFLFIPGRVLAAEPCADGPNGVLVNGCVQKLGFIEYLTALLTQVMPLVFFIALIMIIWSGVQYMLSGFNPGQAGKAKERIVGILFGVAFFLVVGLLINQLAPDLQLQEGGTPTTQTKTP